MKNSKLHRQSGMTLIEVLVSILIFSIGLLGFVGLHMRAIEFSGAAEDSNRAALLANEISAQMQLNQTVALPAGTVTEWQTRVADATAGGLPGGQGVISPGPAANSVIVTITWAPVKAPAGAASHNFATQVVIPSQVVTP